MKRYHYTRKVIKTGLEQAFDHVTGLMWPFQRLPFKCSRNTEENHFVQGYRCSTRATSKLDLCPRRQQSPSGSPQGCTGAGCMSGYMALAACGYSLDTKSSKRLEEPRSVGKGAAVDRGMALGEAPWRSPGQEHSGTEESRSLGKLQLGV